jgi:alpha-L-rhamnosidase
MKSHAPSAGVHLLAVGSLLILGPRLHAGLVPKHLRCEHLLSPVAVDAPQPRLSWIIEADGRGRSQSHYRILAASNFEMLRAHRGDLWDTGKAPSDDFVHIVYAGAPLASGQKVFWKDRVWGQDLQPSDWSAPQLPGGWDC